jgi:hypothetical protein
MQYFNFKSYFIYASLYQQKRKPIIAEENKDGDPIMSIFDGISFNQSSINPMAIC